MFAPDAALDIDPDGFDELIASLRTLQDRVAGVRPTPEVQRRVAGQLRELADELGAYESDEHHQLWARGTRRLGRSQTFVPVMRLLDWDKDRVHGEVRFSRFHLGAYGMAHGGAIALLFDDVLGRLANKARAWAPTAQLDMRFLRPVPIEVDLDFSARFVAEDDKQRTVVGVISLDSKPYTEANGLWRVPRAERNLSLLNADT